MAAPTFASLYRISVRRADGGISFRPKTHNIVSANVKAKMEIFATKMKGNTNAKTCGKKGPGGSATPFKRFRGCLRSSGTASMKG
jgi:hypothetical protein